MMLLFWINLVFKQIFRVIHKSVRRDIWITSSIFSALGEHELSQIRGLGLSLATDEYKIRIRFSPRVMLWDSVSIGQKTGGIYVNYGTCNAQFSKFRSGSVVARFEK